MVFFRRRQKEKKKHTEQISVFPLVTIDSALRVVCANTEFRKNVSPSNVLPLGGVFASILNEDKTRLCEALLSDPTIRLDITTISKSSNSFPIVRGMVAYISRHRDERLYTLTLIPTDTANIKPCSDIHDASELIDFFDNAPIALHWLGGDGRVIWANKRELEVLGYTREEYIGQNIMNFCPDSADTVLEIFKQLGSGNTIRDVPVRFRAKNGAIRDLLIDSNVNFKPDGSFNHTRCFIRDDTTRKVTEARAVVEKKVVQEKEKFVSRILHEMKTPVHVIQMSIQSSDYGLVGSQSSFLGRTLRNVSTAIRFDEGNVVTSEPVSMHLDAFVGEVLSKVKKESLDANIAYVGIEDTHFMFDPNITRVALEEILLNSIHRSKGKQVIFRVVYDSRKLVFAIEDSGDHIDDEHVHDIFQNYWKCTVDKGDNAYENTSTKSDLSSDSTSMGIGMNVAFNHIQCLGSTLEVDSSTDRTCFKFEILSEKTVCDDLCQSRRILNSNSNWSKVDAAAVGTIHVIQPLEGEGETTRCIGIKDPKSRHVLVVDDNTICQKVCKRLLEKLGHTCEVASNGAIAVNMVAQSSFDIIFMDLRMPVMDGIDSAASIRNDLHSDVPIVAFSAETSKDIEAAAMEVMNDFVEKPATSFVIKEVIDKLT